MTNNKEPSGYTTAKLAKLAKIVRANFLERQPKGIEEAIKNRESWVKVFITVFSVLVAGWKLLRTPIEVSGPFDINDLLFVGLAIFSIALASVFYMRATSAVTVSYQQMMLVMQEMLAHQTEPLPTVKPEPGHKEFRVEQEPNSQQHEQANVEKFYEILFSRITLTDIMHYEKVSLDAKFADVARGLPTDDIEFLLVNRYITNDWLLSDKAHTLVLDLTEQFRMKAIG